MIATIATAGRQCAFFQRGVDALSFIYLSYIMRERDRPGEEGYTEQLNVCTNLNFLSQKTFGRFLYTHRNSHKM